MRKNTIILIICVVVVVCTATVIILFSLNKQEEVKFANDFINYLKNDNFFEMSLMTAGSNEYIREYAGTTVSSYKEKTISNYMDFATIIFQRRANDSDEDWFRTVSVNQLIYDNRNGFEIIEVTESVMIVKSDAPQNICSVSFVVDYADAFGTKKTKTVVVVVSEIRGQLKIIEFAGL